MSNQSSKNSLRKRMKSTVLGLSSREREDKDNRIAISFRLFVVDYFKKQITHSGQNQSILNLGVYSPLDDEVKWENAFPIDSLDMELIRFCYPSFESEGKMVFRRSLKDDLEEGTDFGVPIGAPKATAPIEVPDICFIPGLAFSKKGGRLGRGKGYYDRYLEDYSGVKIGVAYSEQLIEDIPSEDHDQLLDGVVTDEGLFYKGKLLNL